MYANRYDRYDDADREDCSCQGKSEGCPGCEGCEKSVITTRIVLCRKARDGAKVGDLIRVTSGFTYQKGGPRLGYFRRAHILGYGPNHPADKIGTGQWNRREGGFAALYPEHTALVEARGAREAEVLAQKQAAQRAETERKAAERSALRNAPEGAVVTIDGEDFQVGKPYTKLVYHSNAEYYGELCDATAYTARKLTNIKTGQTVEVYS